MGRRQAVRHKVLILAFGGSNPSAPAILVFKSSWFLDLDYAGDFFFVVTDESGPAKLVSMDENIHFSF